MISAKDDPKNRRGDESHIAREIITPIVAAIVGFCGAWLGAAAVSASSGHEVDAQYDLYRVQQRLAIYPDLLKSAMVYEKAINGSIEKATDCVLKVYAEVDRAGGKRIVHSASAERSHAVLMKKIGTAASDACAANRSDASSEQKDFSASVARFKIFAGPAAEKVVNSWLRILPLEGSSVDPVSAALSRWVQTWPAETWPYPASSTPNGEDIGSGDSCREALGLKKEDDWAFKAYRSSIAKNARSDIDSACLEAFLSSSSSISGDTSDTAPTTSAPHVKVNYWDPRNTAPDEIEIKTNKFEKAMCADLKGGGC